MEKMSEFLNSSKKDFQEMELEVLKKVRSNIDKIAKDLRKKAVSELSKDKELWKCRFATDDESQRKSKELLLKNPDSWAADKIAELVRRLDNICFEVLNEKSPTKK